MVLSFSLSPGRVGGLGYNGVWDMPFPKVYWKSLRIVLRKTIDYITRWSTSIQPNISETAYDLMIETRDKAQMCLNALPVDDPVE
jgi:hypothetical protein